jgi:hypothetical protein
MLQKLQPCAKILTTPTKKKKKKQHHYNAILINCEV